MEFNLPRLIQVVYFKDTFLMEKDGYYHLYYLNTPIVTTDETDNVVWVHDEYVKPHGVVANLRRAANLDPDTGRHVYYDRLNITKATKRLNEYIDERPNFSVNGVYLRSVPNRERKKLLMEFYENQRKEEPKQEQFKIRE